MDLEQGQVSELANFMGHLESIHRHHYRISLPTQQIARAPKVWEAAIGNMDSSSSVAMPTCSNEHLFNLSSEHNTSASDTQDDPDYNISDDSDCPTIVQRIPSGNYDYISSVFSIVIYCFSLNYILFCEITYFITLAFCVEGPQL